MKETDKLPPSELKLTTLLKEYLPTKQLGSITTNHSFNRLLHIVGNPTFMGRTPTK
jgi:hypothetical protein